MRQENEIYSKETKKMQSTAKEVAIKIGSVPSAIRFKWFARKNRATGKIIKRVTAQHLSYLDEKSLSELAQVAIDNEKKGLEGMIIEAGCALGGSAIVLASVKKQSRPLLVYDVFGMIPQPSENDGADAHERYKVVSSGKSEGIGDSAYYGYQSDLYGKVLQSFLSFGFDVTADNIRLIKGLFQDTLRVESSVSLAHIDCDWYDSVLTCLERIEPHLLHGGTLVIDDYYSWSGCKAAVDKYFAGKNPADYIFIKKSVLHIFKR
jgi:hypothetical protein